MKRFFSNFVWPIVAGTVISYWVTVNLLLPIENKMTEMYLSSFSLSEQYAIPMVIVTLGVIAFWQRKHT